MCANPTSDFQAIGPDYGILTLRLTSSGQWDRSLTTALEWLSKEPENLRGHRVAAQSLINLERTAEAKKHVQTVLAGNPNDDFAHRLMAMVEYKAGNFRAADQSIRKAMLLMRIAPASMTTSWNSLRNPKLHRSGGLCPSHRMLKPSL